MAGLCFLYVESTDANGGPARFWKAARLPATLADKSLSDEVFMEWLHGTDVTASLLPYQDVGRNIKY